MRNCNNLIFWFVKDDGHAIGSANRDANTWKGGYKRVNVRDSLPGKVIFMRGDCLFVDDRDLISVDLLAEDQVFGWNAEGFRKVCTILICFCAFLVGIGRCAHGTERLCGGKS